MKKIIFLVGMFWGVLFAGQAVAQAADPLQMMQNLTNNVQTEIRKNRATIDKDPTAIYGVVNQVILPHVDFVEMSKWMAGKAVWGQASAADQAAFIREFKILVVRTYAASLNRYTDEKIEFLPMQKSASTSRIQIASKIHRSNKEDVRVDYRLIACGDEWKLYDVIIEGVSLLKGFQAQFSEQIHNEGLTVVTGKIRAHNAEKR